jgi:hypothetical protein
MQRGKGASGNGHERGDSEKPGSQRLGMIENIH